jgi:serine/threonine-protein phosphatase 2A regulatory subunit B'
VERYEQWKILQDKAKQMAPNGQLPENYKVVEHPPPTTTIVEDADIMELSMELNAVSLEEVPGDLDESGLERVPMADPGLDVTTQFRAFGFR